MRAVIAVVAIFTLVASAVAGEMPGRIRFAQTKRVGASAEPLRLNECS
jgi:hypothetical protein